MGVLVLQCNGEGYDRHNDRGHIRRIIRVWDDCIHVFRVNSNCALATMAAKNINLILEFSEKRGIQCCSGPESTVQNGSAREVPRLW